MKLCKIVKATAIASLCVGLLGLSGCMNVKPNADEQAIGTVGDGSQLQTYGQGEHKHFTDEEMEKYGFKNGVPSNQVYHFPYDSNVVSESDYDNVAAQAQYLTEHASAHILLEGNTDERGSREYNIALGERRALAVRDLLEADGVPESQIRWVSYGKEKPLVIGHNEAAYEQNRRVNLVYEAR